MFTIGFSCETLVPHSEDNSPSWCTPIEIKTTTEGCNIDIDYESMVTLYDMAGNELDPNTFFSFAPALFDDQENLDVGCCNLPEGEDYIYNNWISKDEIIEIDLGTPYDIDVIYLYDGEGIGAITIEYFDETTQTWESYVQDYVTSLFLKWVVFTNETPPCVPIQKIRVHAQMMEDQIGELLLCGKEYSTYDIDPFTEADELDCGIFAFESSPEEAASNHFWDFGDMNSSTEANLTHTYLENGTYLVTHTITNLCNSVEETIEVTVDCNTNNFGCDCPSNSIVIGEVGQTTSLETYFPTQPNTPLNVIVQGTVNVNTENYAGNLFQFLNGSNICMGEGAQLIIESGSELQFINSHIRGCEKMWRSITVEAGGTLHIKGSLGSVVEDAQYAVSALPNAQLLIQNTTFNKNYVGIYTPPTSNFFNPIVLQQPFQLNNFTSIGDFLEPFEGQTPQPLEITYAGILLNNTQGFTVGHPDTPTSINTFDGIWNGIIAYRSRLFAHFVNFQNIIDEDFLGQPLFSPELRNSIYANNASATVKNCNFTNNRTGITAINSTLNAESNNMNSIGHAFGVSGAYYKQVTIKENNIDNCFATAFVVRNCPNLSMDIINNIVNIAPPNFQFNNELENIPISITANNFISIGDKNFGGNIITTNNNYNFDDGAFYTGIYVCESRGIRLVGNEIDGLEGGSTEAIVILNSDRSVIKENTINCTGCDEEFLPWYRGIEIGDCKESTVTCNTVNSATYSGIRFGGDCEKTFFAGNDMYYNGIVPSFQGEANFAALHLTNAVIGQQPSDIGQNTIVRANEWNNTQNTSNGAFGARYEGSIDPDIVGLSAFIVHGTNNPEHPFTIDGPSNWFTVGNFDPYSCPDPEIFEFAPGDDVKKLIAEGKIAEVGYGLGSQWIFATKLYQELENETDYVASSEAIGVALDSFYLNNQNATIGQFEDIRQEIENLITIEESTQIELEIIESDIDLLENDLQTINIQLVDAQESELSDLINQKIQFLNELNILYSDKEQLILNAEIIRNNLANETLATNEDIEVAEIFEINRKMVNAIFLNTVAVGIDEFDENELKDLQFIANQCPRDGGDAVYQARAMLGIKDNKKSDCLELGKRSNFFNQHIDSEEVDLAIYPNPSSGIITIEGTMLNENITHFELYNLAGQKVFQQELIMQDKSQLSFKDLVSGIYFYKLSQNSVSLKLGKLVIE